MDWILEHMRVLILVGGAIAYWLNQRRKARQEAEDERSRPAVPVLPQMQMNEEAERVRRIQEEIRRKILERATGGIPRMPPLPQPETPVPTLPRAKAPVREDAYSVPGDNSRAAENADRVLLEEQQALLAKVRDLENSRRHGTTKKAEAFAERTTAALETAATKGSILSELRDPASIRRAVILREVLGAPVGLR